MANPLHRKTLRESVSGWNKWRRLHPTVVPDLSGSDLSGVELTSANLIKANLTGAKLIIADATKEF